MWLAFCKYALSMYLWAPDRTDFNSLCHGQLCLLKLNSNTRVLKCVIELSEDPQSEDYLLSEAQHRPSMYPKRSIEKKAVEEKQQTGYSYNMRVTNEL